MVISKPRQVVSGSWTVVCSRGYGAGSKSGNFSQQTFPVNGVNLVTYGIKLPMAHPDSCTVSASAQLDRSGRINVQLFAFR
jgi:hypothetical protein